MCMQIDSLGDVHKRACSHLLEVVWGPWSATSARRDNGIIIPSYSSSSSHQCLHDDQEPQNGVKNLFTKKIFL